MSQARNKAHKDKPPPLWGTHGTPTWPPIQSGRGRGSVPDSGQIRDGDGGASPPPNRGRRPRPRPRTNRGPAGRTGTGVSAPCLIRPGRINAAPPAWAPGFRRAVQVHPGFAPGLPGFRSCRPRTRILLFQCPGYGSGIPCAPALELRGGSGGCLKVRGFAG
jgi:hypothetical protein